MKTFSGSRLQGRIWRASKTYDDLRQGIHSRGGSCGVNSVGNWVRGYCLPNVNTVYIILDVLKEWGTTCDFESLFEENGVK